MHDQLRLYQDFPGSSDPETIEKFEQLWEEDQKNCRACQEMIPPPHFRPHRIIETDGGRQLTVSPDCGSNGRRFDVLTRQFIGRSHCTCDTCF